VYYSARVEFARPGPPIPAPDPNAPSPKPWFEFDPVDPADLYGTWTSQAEAGGGANRRESVLEFRPDGELTWTMRITGRDALELVIAEKYMYEFLSGRLLALTLAARSVGGKEIDLPAVARQRKVWKLEWKADDRSGFQLRTDSQDEGRPHLLFQKSPPSSGKKG
jgi:hypothetical protein